MDKSEPDKLMEELQDIAAGAAPRRIQAGSSFSAKAYPGLSSGALSQLGGGIDAQWTPETDYHWEQYQQQLAAARTSKETLEALRQLMQQQVQAAAAVHRRMSKEELCRGILKEVVAMRERLDQLTAAVTSELLDSEPTKTP